MDFLHLGIAAVRKGTYKEKIGLVAKSSQACMPAGGRSTCSLQVNSCQPQRRRRAQNVQNLSEDVNPGGETGVSHWTGVWQRLHTCPRVW